MLNDAYYMALAFDEAKKGIGNTSPNPLVGCVIVKEARIIAKGYHKKAGLAHAEIDAINNATESVHGATLYCNLEPCCHTNKRTPPCAQRLVSEKIKRVVIANLDPNPEVAGRGVKILEEAGIEVLVGVMKEEGLLLNEIFFTHITSKKPFLTLKMAQTLDAKLATLKNESKWITGSAAREHVHGERKKHDAILVGADTVRFDNPSLTTRTESELIIKKRIILSLSGDFNKELKVFSDEYKSETILVLPDGVSTNLEVKTIHVSLNNQGTFHLEEFLRKIYELGITSIYIEGGSKVHTSFLKEKLFDRISIYIAPKIIGTGISSFGELGIEKLSDAITFSQTELIKLEEDFLFTAKRK